MGGLWYPRSGVDRSCLLPVVCQRGLYTQFLGYVYSPKQEHSDMSAFVQIVISYKTNKKLEQMLQNLYIYVTPVINVDGYTFTWGNDSVSASQLLLL